MASLFESSWIHLLVVDVRIGRSSVAGVLGCGIVVFNNPSHGLGFHVPSVPDARSEYNAQDECVVQQIREENYEHCHNGHRCQSRGVVCRRCHDSLQELVCRAVCLQESSDSGTHGDMRVFSGVYVCLRVFSVELGAGW